MTVMVTGHRQLIPLGWTGNPWPENNPIVANHHHELKQVMITFCRQMFDIGQTEFISGMAIGADQLFANAVIELKRAGYPITLVAAVPFQGQENNWPEYTRVKFRNILSCADKVQIVSPGGYEARKMQIRNCWMVDNSDIVLAVWDGKKEGGTWNCISYAVSKNKVMVNLEPKTLSIKMLPK